jgi:hypothetical protein
MISIRDSEIKKKNLELLEKAKMMNAIEQERDKLKAENKNLKKTI